MANNKLKRKYGSNKEAESGLYITATDAAAASAAFAANQKNLGVGSLSVRTGKSPIAQNAKPRKNYSIRKSNAEILRGQDTSPESAARYRQRVQETARQGLEKFRADRERRNAQIRSREDIMAQVHDNLAAGGGAALANAVDYGRNLVEDTSWREPGAGWREDWLEEFGLRYLQDPEDAYSYARQINDSIKAGKLQEQQKALGKTGALASMALGVAAAPLGMADPIEKVLEYAARGTVTQRGNVTPATFSRDLTGAVGQRLNEEHGTIREGVPILGGKGWGDLYGIVNSAVQSMALGNVLGSAGTLATYFGQSAGGGMEEIKARGGTDEQAILYGLASGAFEALAEKLPLDNLLKGGDAVHYTLKSFLGNAAKQGFFEGSEEAVTSIANELADRVIMGDKSNFNMTVRELVAQGMDEEEAKEEAWKRYASDMAFDFLGGALSGAGSMAVQTGPSTIMANHQTRKAYTPEMDAALLEIAGQTEEGSRPYNLAREYKKQGGDLSGGQLNQLAGVYEEYTDAQDAEELTEAAREKLEAMDAEDDTVARAIVKKLTGQELNRRERRALERSAEGKKVLQDMQAEQGLPATPNTPDAGYPWKPGNTMLRNYEQDLRNPAADPLMEAIEAQEIAGAAMAAEEGAENAHSEPVNDADEFAGETVAENATVEPSGISGQLTEDASEAAQAVEASVDNVEETASIPDDSGAEVEPEVQGRTIEEVAGEYGVQGNEIRKLYQEGQDVEGFASAVRASWEMGGSGIPMERVNSSPRTQGITAEQRRTAYLLGQGAARVAAQSQDKGNAKKATGGTVRRKGVVKAQSGITIKELSDTFNDRQRSAYKLLSFYAEVTGIDVVLYKGTQEQETGRFAHGEDTIYIDITAGTNGWDTTDLSAYTMMRTFAHEFVHFVEKWSAEQYNQLREVVFSQMEKNGQDAEALVELAMQEQGLTFDQASREVVAEALTDILPDSQFVQTLASKHKSLFEKIKERLEAFVTELKDHWKKLTGNNSREAVALTSQVGEALGYAEEVLQAFDRAAGEAVEAYQQTVAKKQGRVHAEGIADDLSELQKSSIRALEAVADALDLQIHLYESTADENGIRNAPNGYYDTSTGDIWLDVNAGLGGEGTMLFTAAHELTHFIKQWSPEKFQKLADFLVEKYGEKGISAEELVERQQAKAERTGRELDYDAAFEEMVADSMEAMLSDGDVVQRLSELKQTDKGLWEKLKEKFAELVQKIRAAYKGLKPDSAEGKYVAEMLDAAEKLKELFAEGLTDAAQNHHPTPAEQSVVDDSDIEFSARENVKLSARDTAGRELSQEQQEYFRDSKVRDEQGRLMVMYHGTPNGNHTKFRSGTYFTPMQEYADKYQNPNASMLSVKKNADAPKTYEVYLNITKPFDTRNPRERKIFMEEYYRQWGTGAPLADSGLPDWTDGMDLQEFIEEMEYDYDGLILDEGATGGYGLEVQSRGLSYVTFSPEQVKNVDNKSPTGNPDIRFSDRDPAAQKLNRALEKENAAQAQEIQYLRELVKLQGQVTNGTKFTRSSVRTLAQQLMKDAGAKGNYLELSEKLNGIYESIATQDDPLGMSWDEVEGRIDEAARWLVEHIEVKQDRGEYANDILRDLRGRKISLNAGQRAEVEGRYGSYDTFRKSMFGSVTISKDGTPLDMVWQELSSQYPGTFDADIGDADMALELADVVARLRETDVAAMEFEMRRDGLLEDLRHKVYDGYWKVSTLHTVADKWQKKVDALKQQHQDTMKKLDKARQERDAANADRIDSVKKVREQKNEAVKKVRQQYQESKKKSAEGRKKTEMRHKIQRVVKELNDLLLKPDKKHHVPEGLRKAVAEALDMVNMDYLDAAGKIEAINDELAQLHTERVLARKAGETKEAAELLGKIRQLEQRKARLEDQGGRMDEKLEALHTAYEKIKESADPEIANAYDEGLSSYILMKAAMVGDTPLKNMNMEQLGHVYDLYQMVLKTIRDANKAFNEAITEGIREMADNADREITSNGKRNRLGIKMVEQLRKFGINNLKPTYFFHYLNSRTFRQLYQGLLDGQGQFARNMDEARSFRQEQVKKYGAKNWDREKTWKFKAASGEKFSLNLEQIMSLYAYSKRDQSREHIRRGGIVIDADTEIQEVKEVAGGFKVKLKGKSQDATAYNIDDVTLGEIIGKLTAKQRAYVDAMQDYLSDTMGAKGNEVSLKLYGIKLFKEKHYFPLKSAREYSARAKEQAEQTARLKNAGFTKATKPHASNPIMLTGFSDVWADHVQDMSSYHAMTLPIEDIYRVYNYSRNGDGVKGARSVVAAIENAFGKQATGYMDQLLKDLNGGQIMDSAGELLEQMTSRFKKGAVFMSASVMIQQSSSVARALAEIDAKYLSPLSYVESLTVVPRQLLGKVDKNASRSHDALWAELKQYAPVAIIKEMGSFDMNMGKSGRDYLNGEEYSGLQEKWQAFWKDGNFRDELFSRGPALADELAWCDIWRAVKREVHDKHPKLKISSEEFLKLCGARFTEIIDKTQVYDSVLSRSANMRSKNGAMKMATNFMAEPTVNSNMMAAAILEGKRGNAKKARRMAGAVMAGNIINAALAAIVYAARDDDEDEEYWEKYLGHLAGEVADSMNPLTYIPVAQDIVSVFQGWDVERADMAIVSDLYNAWNKLFSDKATTWEKTRDVVGAVSQIFSLPLKNALKDAEALWRVVSDAFDGQESTATGIGYAILAELPEWVPGGGVRNNGDQLYEAILSGDKAHEERVRERFRDKNGDIDEGKVRSALRKAIRENDSRVREAAVYLNEGQLLEYYNIVEEIAGEGFFHKDDVVSAIQSEANAMQEDSGNKETAIHHKSAFKAEHFAIATADGDSQMMNIIKADLILTAQDNGKTETEAEAAAVGTIRGAVKEAFVEEGMLNESQVKKSLMGWCDATEKEASDTLKEWAFEKQNGYPLSELEDVFVGGEITANKAEGFLVSSGGYARTEAQSKVLQWRCEVDTGIRYDDVQQLYVGGKLTADKAKELRVKYGESSIEDARKTVLQWQCEKDNGIKYSDIDVAYLSGDITEKTAIKWLVKYGEKDEETAALATQAYRWRDQHTEYKDLSNDKIDRYIDYCESAGISIPDFYEANKRVSEISEAGGTVKDNVVRYIRSLPLSRQQKWAMWYAVKTKSWKDNVSF